METVGLSCPIDGTQVNETVIRLVAGQVVVLIVLSVFNGFYWLTAFVLVDFTLRGFFEGKGSLLKLVAKFIARSFKLKAKLTDGAPKKFAARIGFVVISGLLAAQILDESILIYALAGAIVTFAILESVFAICVGCILYQRINRFRSVVSR